MDQHTSYVVKDNQIGYVHGDRVVYNMSFGYLTAFSYLKEVEKGSITNEQLELNIGLRVSCGNFSYAEIPKKFSAILGISGTVDTIIPT